MTSARVGAALDVGSNTIRLLVARETPRGLETVLDRSEFVRLGKDVDRTGELDPARMDTAVRVIAELADVARQHGAAQITAVGTSALRDARNGGAFVERVREDTGVEIEVISGSKEAELTFRGASLGLPLEDRVVVVDLGGGSAELIAAAGHDVQWAESLPLGSGRLTERYLQHDPPGRDEIERLMSGVRGELDKLPPFRSVDGIFTGGTATHLALLAGRSDFPAALTRDDVQAALEAVLTSPAQQIAEAHNFRLERAQVLPAGMATLLAIGDHFGLHAWLVTQQGIREGALIAARL